MLNLKGNTQNLTSHGLMRWSAEKRYVSYTDRWDGIKSIYIE
jgi:hypothetical protein